jgi:hypothetical protein
VASDVYARRLGINGVPCFIVNRKYAVSGAQPPSAFVEVFNLAETRRRHQHRAIDGVSPLQPVDKPLGERPFRDNGP